MTLASVNCLISLRQLVCCALRLALDKAGSNIAARMAMMAMTTSNSINVNPDFIRIFLSILYAFMFLRILHGTSRENCLFVRNDLFRQISMSIHHGCLMM